VNEQQTKVYKNAENQSKAFFDKPHEEKAACVDSQSYAGYIASGEEITDGVADYSEIFTITKDLPATETRVQEKWPCHGPCPWPNDKMKTSMKTYMDYLGKSGEKLLSLIELGLEVPQQALTRYTEDGWHHMRVLRFPPTDKTNGKGKTGRGIGSHTDYGLLVIAAQDDVGGLFIRPPYKGESTANWESSAAGLNENDDKWVYVPPVEGTFTVFPGKLPPVLPNFLKRIPYLPLKGDMMQYMTNSFLPSTPHKVGLNTRDRFAFAYFHEPSFQAVIKPLPGYDVGQSPKEGIHYGTHFTNMFMRNYEERITTKRMKAEDRYRLLEKPELRTMASETSDTSRGLGQGPLSPPEQNFAM